MINEILQAGDTLAWTESDATYPAPSWILKYRLTNSSTALTLTSTASETNHAFSISHAASKLWTAGKYKFTRFVVNQAGTEIHTLDTGTLEIKAYLLETASSDVRTHAKKVLDAIEAVLESRATKEQESISIAGRSLVRMSLEELIKARNNYRWEVQNEIKAEKIAQGIDPGKRVLLRFSLFLIFFLPQLLFSQWYKNAENYQEGLLYAAQTFNFIDTVKYQDTSYSALFTLAGYDDQNWITDPIICEYYAVTDTAADIWVVVQRVFTNINPRYYDIDTIVAGETTVNTGLISNLTLNNLKAPFYRLALYGRSSNTTTIVSVILYLFKKD